MSLLLSAIILALLSSANAIHADEKFRFSVAAVTGSYMDEFVAIEKGYHQLWSAQPETKTLGDLIGKRIGTG